MNLFHLSSTDPIYTLKDGLTNCLQVAILQALRAGVYF